MKSIISTLILLAFINTSLAQDKNQEFSINGFRNPSIGLEYRYQNLSIHGGYYLTNFTSNVTTRFVKAGLTYWFIPTGTKEIPSSFYLGSSYLRGLTREYEDKNAIGFEAGYRWVIWKGLNFRIGAIALAAEAESLKINPTPGLSYTIKF